MEKNTSTDRFNLSRFLDAQEFIFQAALGEISSGRKRSHWMWYIFPQLRGLGHSYNSHFYGIESADEARAYLADGVLSSRLRRICDALLSLPGNDSVAVFGDLDSCKLRSSMTLFDAVAPGEVFAQVLAKYFGGSRCSHTLDILASQVNKPVKVYNLMILDESGSMSCIYNEAINGVNSTIDSMRQAVIDHPNQRHYVSLIAFDSDHYNRIYNCAPSQKVGNINTSHYHPGGCTPLFDAMGRAITELSHKVNDGDVVLVTIITDGCENCSTRYTAASIKALVESKKEQGWVFTYIGANQDVEAVAKSMAIDSYCEYESTAESTNAMFAKEQEARRRFFKRINEEEDRRKFNKDYYDNLDS